MDICAIICEFNPFHNGHGYLLSKARELSRCDALLCIMSGSFTQRGEMCVMDKYTRARHAIYGGADAVLELPAPFAVAPAQIFAEGSVKILSSIPQVSRICFGCEDELDFSAAAKSLLDEDDEFRKRLNEIMSRGTGYAAAYGLAAGEYGKFLQKPNNILGIEYAKANIKYGGRLGLLPVKRLGSGYSCPDLDGEYASAKAIRLNRNDDGVRNFVPTYVFDDLKLCEDRTDRFFRLCADALFFADAERLSSLFGCTEGLENRLKKLSMCGDYEKILSECTGKRYSATRIRRILTENLLGLSADACRAALGRASAARVLAVKRDMADSLLPLLGGLNGANDEVISLTDRSYAIWRYINYPYGEGNVNQKINFV